MKDGNYVTSGIGLSAFFLCRGYQVVSIEPRKGSWRFLFVFPAQAEQAAEAYFNSGQVGAQEFMGAIRRLKSQIRHVQRTKEIRNE